MSRTNHNSNHAAFSPHARLRALRARLSRRHRWEGAAPSSGMDQVLRAELQIRIAQVKR